MEHVGATKTERLQRAWHKFDNDKDHKPTGTRQAVEWVVAQGLIELPDVDPYDVLAEQMSQALRATQLCETATGFSNEQRMLRFITIWLRAYIRRFK